LLSIPSPLTLDNPVYRASISDRLQGRAVGYCLL
jgi:hypothetical protein